MRFLALLTLLLAGCGAAPTAMQRVATAPMAATRTCSPYVHKCDDPTDLPTPAPSSKPCAPGYVHDPRTGQCVWVGRR